EIQNQLQKNAFYVLEQVATRPLILQEAKKWADQSGQNSKSATDDALLQKFLESIAPANLRVSEEEAKTFYDQNQEAFGETPYDTVKPQVDEFLLSQKKQNAINTYIGSLSEHLPVEVSADWTKQQSILTLENPVDQARRSGKPAMIDFGASGCIPCDMMAPILKELATTYSGKCSVLFIDVRNEQVLAARYGISVIPTQLFFDPSGKEISRHTGFFPRDQILEQLATAGVK
ncbi:MAG: thioredoxin domain-containing protein, partial [Candidatus Atribacteria bacterium]|nr:thioredoxin domain-containing protein [Candidatus Atribacteria bacterium]